MGNHRSGVSIERTCLSVRCEYLLNYNFWARRGVFSCFQISLSIRWGSSESQNTSLLALL